MAWIESHSHLVRHRKLCSLARDLRLKPVYVMGHLHALWHVALEQQEDGDLSSWTDEFIADSACFTGDAPQFVSLLIKHGWIDENRVLHDWLDYVGKYLTRKYSTSNRHILVAIWLKHGRSYGVASSKEADSEQIVTLQYSTNTPNLPNQPTHPPPRAREGKRLHGIPSCVEDVIAYGATVRVSEERCRRFWAHYEGQAKTNPNGDVFWVTSGENPAVVTNWKVKLPMFDTERSRAANTKLPAPKTVLPVKRL